MFILVFMIGPYVKYTPQNSSTPPVIPPPVTSTVTRVVTPTPVVDHGTPLPDPGLVGALNDLKADFDQYKKKQQQLITLLEKTDEDIINNHTKEVLDTMGELGNDMYTCTCTCTCTMFSLLYS